MELTKKELIALLADFFNKPKNYFKSAPKEALDYLWEEEVLPEILDASH